MTNVLSPSPKLQFFDAAGNPAAGYKLYTYQNGTTTPQTTYANRAGTVANANPIIMDARGEAVVYLAPGLLYSIALKTNLDATVWVRDGVAAEGDASAISFLQAGAGAVARTVENRIRESISIKDFGDTSTPSGATAALKAAIARASVPGAPRTIKIPHGTYGITEQIVISAPIQIVGEGSGYYEWQGHAPDSLTELVWSGSETSNAMILFANTNFGSGGLSRLTINSNDKSNGVYYENAVGTVNSSLYATGFVDFGVKLNGVGSTCSWNTFINLKLESSPRVDGKCCLWLAGSPNSNGNACHNTFITTQINHHRTRHAIYLGGCDNNVFTQTMIYRVPGGSGHGVHCDFTESAPFPNGNTFVHLQAGDGGYFEPAAGRSSFSRPTSIIWGYQTDNGQPYPVLTDGARVPILTDVGQLSGLTSISRANKGANFIFGALINPGVTSSVIPFPAGAMQTNDYILVANINGTPKPWAISSKTTTSFSFDTDTPFAVPTAVAFMLVGN